jgi:hypothetical protein
MAPRYRFSTMAWLPDPWSDYRDAADFDRAWCDLARACGARASIAGTSVEGRPIRRFELGREDGPTVLLTGLVHGVELIGSVALLDFVGALGEGSDLLRTSRIVVMPIVNPDALHENTSRIARGERAARRSNARGVDLNRNFPRIGAESPWNPLAGSRFRASPWYAGAHAFSEPETRAVRDVALETRPSVSIGFHSFGDLLLYPWAHTRKPNPRRARYERAGGAFRRSLRHTAYEVMQATQFYATVGDMDDWLDAELGTLAFTVEVSRPMRRFANARRMLQPFAWHNPTRVAPVVENVTPALGTLVRESLAA